MCARVCVVVVVVVVVSMVMVAVMVRCTPIWYCTTNRGAAHQYGVLHTNRVAAAAAVAVVVVVVDVDVVPTTATYPTTYY